MSGRRRTSRRGQEGMVTAEAALVIPVLLAVTLALSWTIAVGAAQVRLIDAAREGARLAARGESSDTVEAAVRRIGPSDTHADVSVSNGMVTVQVQAHVSPGLPLLGDLPGVSLESRAVAASEETALP